MPVKNKVLIFGGLLAVLFGFCGTAKAATLSVRPALENYSVGQEFTATVYIASPDQPANAISGTLSFPPDKLQVVSVSKVGSVVNIWVQEPAFSNGDGSVSFEGVVLNPGFTGASANVLTVRFRAKAFGLSQVSFSSASVLANDGLGTNILTGFTGASYNLSGPGTSPPAVTNPSVSANTPQAPNISSDSHPDSNKWYPSSDAKFVWGPLGPDVTSARVLVSKIPNAIPVTVYTPAIDSKEFTGIDDGVWYLNVQLRNKYGWGGISHFRFQVDVQPPRQFSIIFPNGQEGYSPKPEVIFRTTDDASGVAMYRLKIGDGDFFNVDPSQVQSGAPYVLPEQYPGKRTLLVQAVDEAGNIATAATDFTVLALAAPKITNSPKTLTEGDILNIGGQTEPNSLVTIHFKSPGLDWETQFTRSDSNGNFTFAWGSPLTRGTYSLWTQTTDANGAHSSPSDTLSVVVSGLNVVQVGPLYIKTTIGLVIFYSVLATLLFSCFFFWYKWRRIKKSAKKGPREIVGKIHLAFDILRESVIDHIRALEKIKNVRHLTAAEDAFLKQLKKDLEKAEKTIESELG